MDSARSSVYDENCPDDQLPSYESALRSQHPRDDDGVTKDGRSESHGISSYGITLYPFYGEFSNELTFKAGQIIHLIRHIDKDWMEGELDGSIGIFPKSFIDIIVDVHEENATEDGTFDDQVTEVYPPDCFARVLFDFKAEEENDLELQEGSTITLLRKIGNDWVEAMDDANNFGICPLNYVEIITEQPIDASVPIPRIQVESQSTVETSVKAVANDSFLTQRTGASEEINFDLSALEVSTRSFDTGIASPFQPQTTSSPHTSDQPSTEFSLRDLTVSRTSYGGPSRPAPPRPSAKPFEEKFGLHNNPSIQTETLTPWSADDASGPRKAKENEQRKVILTELLQSERDYLHHLNVCHRLLRAPANSNESIRKILGNLPQVIQVSTDLTAALEEAINFKDGKGVGKCFMRFAPSMKDSYDQVFQNSKDAQAIWAKLSASTHYEVKKMVESINEGIRNETNSYDLPSLILKPVQRVLKYPLLLSELCKFTKDVDEQRDLGEALVTMTTMASEFNESKRRKELVTKYRSSSKGTLASNLSKWNLHTFRKKSSRLGYKITSKIGFHSNVKDNEFDSLAVKFRSLEKTLKIFIKDLSLVVESQESILKYAYYFVNSLSEFYGSRADQGEVDHLVKCHKRLLDDTWSETRKYLKHNVFEVLNVLLSKFSGPSHLIDKRNDKLADFDSLSRKIDCDSSLGGNNKVREDHLKAKNDYEALNSQLLDELPKLISLSVEVINNCLAAYMKLQKHFIGKTSQQMLNLLDTCFNKYSNSGSFDSQDIYDTFHVKFNLLLNDLTKQFTLVPSNLFVELNPTSGKSNREKNKSESDSNETRKGTNLDSFFTPSNQITGNAPFKVTQSQQQMWIPQTTNQKEILLNRFKPADLYNVIQEYKGVEPMHLTLKVNDMVGVIKRHNPMGSQSQWLVDDGNHRGFVPATILQQIKFDDYAPPPVPSRNSSIEKPPRTSRQNSEVKDLLSFDENDSSSLGACAPSRASPLPEDLIQFDPLAASSSSTNSQEKAPTVPVKDSNCSPVALPPNPSTLPSNANSTSGQVFVALYPFTSTSSGTLSLHLGQFIKVKAFADLNGNKEWCLVEDSSGKTGYVPFNYIKPHNTNQ